MHDRRVSRIRILSEGLASRIAAGEVVERPASVVKELVENALDAGARRIDIRLEGGGRRRIVVTDDGCGMDRDDALLAFEQHATSKIASDADLAALGTFGFRGEALAAIGACSRVRLTTAESDGEGTRVRFEEGTLREVGAVGAPRGTAVEVSHLFASLPARRKFLRTAATELSRVVAYLEQQALARPDVHLTLGHDRTRLELPPAEGIEERVRQVLGTEFTDASLRATGRRGDLSVDAWLVRSGQGPGRLSGVRLLVNGRVVTDRMLTHAVREASRSLFGVDAAPAGLVLVHLPPSSVDANVHPAKREVRFARPWEVHDAVRDLLRAETVSGGFFAPAVGRDDVSGRLADTSGGGSRPGVASGRPVDAGSVGLRQGSFAGPSLPGAAALAGQRAPSPATPLGSGRRVLGQHRNTYVIVEDEQGLVLIDQHCAHERVLFERLMDELETGAARQALLEPVVVELPASLVPVLLERRDDLARLGFEVDEFGGSSVAVRAVPSAARGADPAELVRELASREDPADGPVERVSRLAATIACKAAVKAGFPLGAERMGWLVDQLYAARIPTTCPHGRVALLRLSDRDLDHRFGRP